MALNETLEAFAAEMATRRRRLLCLIPVHSIPFESVRFGSCPGSQKAIAVREAARATLATARDEPLSRTACGEEQESG
jgi:hypothetical protein